MRGTAGARHPCADRFGTDGRPTGNSGASVKIATWNINGVKARLDTAVRWLGEAEPDVVCLQEIKSVDEGFPGEAFERLGYNVTTHGQKGFNGVAILSKRPLEDAVRGLEGAPDDVQARYLEGVVPTDTGGIVRVASIYLPNGNPIDTEKFPYKLAWAERLIARAEELLALEEATVLAGDYNVIPDTVDARKPEAWVNDALFQPELHLLGLPGRRLAAEQRHPHRPHAAVAPGRRQARGRRHRQPCARLGKTLRPRAGDRHAGALTRAGCPVGSVIGLCCGGPARDPRISTAQSALPASPRETPAD